MQVNFTHRAEQGFIEIYRYGLAHFGIQPAETYAQALFDVMALIARQPEMARRYREFTPPVRIHRPYSTS